MSVRRIWFINQPSGAIDEPQRAQIGIGYSFNINPTPPTPPVPPVDYIIYLRSYLGDNDDPALNISLLAEPEAIPNVIDVSYIRSYLGDS